MMFRIEITYRNQVKKNFVINGREKEEIKKSISDKLRNATFMTLETVDGIILIRVEDIIEIGIF